MVTRPPYSVPTMQEIAALPSNGFTVASTFSGGGGSSLGYRMAGFKVVYASEFVAAARETYAANAPTTDLDDRDIRTITGEDLLARLGMVPGQLDLFDGSPPCASFSTAGRREKDWGKSKTYSDTRQRTDDLFFEYVRLVNALQPKVFVAENVSGLVKGTAKGYFRLILAALKDCGYTVSAKLLNAAYLGVPQARQRLIFMGVRNDLGMAPVFPSPLPYRYTVRDALPWILAQGGAGVGGWGTGRMRLADEPSPTIGASPQSGNGRCPPSIVHDTSGLYGAGDITNKPSPTISVGVNSVNSHHFQVRGDTPEPVTHDPETGKLITKMLNPALVKGLPSTACRRFTLGELRAICGFPADFILTGTYEQRWERLGRAVPPLMMREIARTVRDEILAKA
jgi:DNA (cytosine-5)-methyltransferase 1